MIDETPGAEMVGTTLATEKLIVEAPTAAAAPPMTALVVKAPVVSPASLPVAVAVAAGVHEKAEMPRRWAGPRMEADGVKDIED